MAPKTIAICKNPDGIDPISPLPVRINDFAKTNSPSPQDTSKTRNSRFLSGKAPTTKQGKELEDLKTKYEETKVQMEEMKRQKNENNKKLLEMSGLVKSLQGNPDVQTEETAEGDNFANVQRKIEGIMTEMDDAKKRYDELKSEKWFQSDTIQEQNQKIREMESQIQVLNDRLKEEELEQKQKQNKAIDEQMATTEELEQQVMLQEMEIMNLMAEIEQKRQKEKNEIGNKIKETEASNAAKYAEIQKMEEQLANMQKQQEDFKEAQANIVGTNAEFVAKPTPQTFAEINKLQDNIANLRQQQESIRPSEQAITSEISPAPKARITKSSPWNSDLRKKEGIVDKETELDVVANNDINPAEDSLSEEQNLLSLPSLDDISQSMTSIKKPPSVDLESIEEEKNEQPVEIEKTKTLDSNSATSATKTMSDDDESSKLSSAFANNVEVEIQHTDNGSIETISYTKKTLKAFLSQISDDESSSEESNKSSESESSRSAESSAASSSRYTSDTSTQSSSRSILEQIPEEAESDAESQNSESVNDKETKELQTGSLILRKQLKDSESKYEKLMSDYKQLVSKSQMRTEKLQQENQKLRDDKVKKLKSKANDSEEEKKLRWLKQENKMLLTSMEKQNEVLDKANKNYDKLQQEHSATLAMLEEKNRRYDKLALDFSKRSGSGGNSEDYDRLMALHENVVLKLADMGEDNDRLEKERDDAIDALENSNMKIRAYDEAVASLNKTEYDLKMLENVHGETIEELQQLSEKNKELQASYDKQIADAKDHEKIQEDYVKVKTELEILVASNKDLSGIQEKLNASEVKVAMLEEEDKKLKEKLLATKQKSKIRADQLKDVISQYKTLNSEFSEKCEELDRLKIAADGLDSESGLKAMKKMTDSLQKTKKEVEEAKKGKKARENDLKIVLQHYEKLQLKYQKIRAKLDSKTFDEASNGSGSQPFDEASSVQEEKKEEDSSVSSDVQNVEKLLKESKESGNWKDNKIVQTLNELNAAKEEIKTLESEKKGLENELSDVKSKLLLARKEADNAEEKQGNGQDRLRSAVSKQHQLQQVYDSLLKKFGDVQSELQMVKKDMKVKEEEEKQARKRATVIQTQYKKLQEDHSVVVERLEKLKKEMAPTSNNDPAEC